MVEDQGLVRYSSYDRLCPYVDSFKSLKILIRRFSRKHKDVEGSNRFQEQNAEFTMSVCGMKVRG